jgi:hypothetical protein
VKHDHFISNKTTQISKKQPDKLTCRVRVFVSFRQLILASIGGGGGIARQMFVRVKVDRHWGGRIDAHSYLCNAYLPIAQETRVAVLLVGQLRTFHLTSPWIQAHVISAIGTESVDVFAAVRPLPSAPPGSACSQVRSALSEVVSCHEVATITGTRARSASPPPLLSTFSTLNNFI